MTGHPGRDVGWFPLAPRPHPPGRPLKERVEEVTSAALGQEKEGGELASAARVFNRASLIASDTGTHQTARRWCWRHAVLYLNWLPLDAALARALEPVVNLARLRIRIGEGVAAYRLLDTLHDALRAGEHLEVDGRHLPLDQLTATRTDQSQIAQWLWKVRPGDGLRALASAVRARPGLPRDADAGSHGTDRQGWAGTAEPASTSRSGWSMRA